MRKLVAIATAAVLVSSFLFCTDRPSQTTQSDPNDNPPVVRTPAQLTTQETGLLNSCNKFGLNLFREVVAKTPATDNVFISPLSVSYALGLTYNGAKGETREAIGNTLQLAGLSIDELNKAYHDLTEILVYADPEVDFRVANSFWSREGKAIEPQFIDAAKTWFDARVEEINFQAPWAADTINAWIERATNGKIKEMVKPPIDASIAAMLFNAIYFKGSWMFPFDVDDTRTADFILADGTTTQCRMMNKSQEDCQQPGPGYPDNLFDMHTDTNITWYSDDEVFVLSMPYGQGDYRMSIVIPNRWSGYPNNDPDKSIDEVIAGLDDTKWSTWMEGHTPERFDLGLPRFKFGFEVSLKEVLKTLGMEIAFSAARADFSNMFSDGSGWIDEVKHKTFVQVDEKGTEAAAVTQIVFIDSMPPQMICDRPFLIVIHEDVSGAILFMGRIANPVWEDE